MLLVNSKHCFNELGGAEALWEHIPRSHRRAFANFNEDPAFPNVGIFWQDGVANTAIESHRHAMQTTAAPTTTAPPPSLPDVDGLDPWITPNADFYRIDTALSVPMVDPEAWSLSVEGLVKNPYRLTFNDLLAMDLIERTVTLCCVSNEVGGSLVGNATWTGVPLQDVLGPAEPLPGGEQVMARSAAAVIDRQTEGVTE